MHFVKSEASRLGILIVLYLQFPYHNKCYYNHIKCFLCQQSNTIYLIIVFLLYSLIEFSVDFIYEYNKLWLLLQIALECRYLLNLFSVLGKFEEIIAFRISSLNYQYENQQFT